MHDIKAIRENPVMFDEGLKRRGLSARSAQLIELDTQRRACIQTLQDLQARRNVASREIGAAMGLKDVAEAERLKAEVAGLKDQVQAGEAQERTLNASLDEALADIPNIPLSDVPYGTSEADNVELRRVGTKPDFAWTPLQHFEIGEALGLMDFEAAARMSGTRFVVLKGALARLERALGQFMLDVQTQDHGYTEVSAPLMLRTPAMYGVGQLPKFAEDLFHTTNDFWLIPTAEASLTNLVREQELDEAKLPLRLAALTACFRAEAGAAGRDTRGMIRQHQFYKVELVSVTTPEQSPDEHERMTGCAEEILKRLGLHFRTILLCTGDMGFGSCKTCDIEVWLPGQGQFREISSCSRFGDFQARRIDARSRGTAGASRHVHTLNGSGLAVGRTLVAILENYQQADGSVIIPEVLEPYMGGLKRISRTSS